MIDGNLEYCQSHQIEAESVSTQDWQGKFDVVTCMEVIEHLHTPYYLIDLISGLMAKGGVCVIETNNVRKLGGIFKLIMGGSNLDFELVSRFNPGNRSVKHPHVRFYSVREVTELLKRAGLKVTAAYSFPWYPPKQYLTRPFRAVINRLEGLISGFASHIIVRAQKL